MSLIDLPFLPPPDRSAAIIVPKRGRISVMPTRALLIEQGTIAVPLEHLYKDGAAPEQPHRFFAMTMVGDGMEGVGLHDKDTLLFRSMVDVEDGSIVAVDIGGEKCVRRIRRRGSAVILEAAHPVYDTLNFFGAGAATIGTLVGMLRTYAPQP